MDVSDRCNFPKAMGEGELQSNNLVVLSLLNFFHSEHLEKGRSVSERMKVLSTTIEHPSVLELLKALEAQQRIGEDWRVFQGP